MVLIGRRETPLEETAALAREVGGEAVVVAGDVADAWHRRAALDAAERAYGGLDILINNAGNIAAGRLETLSEDDIWAMVQSNLLAPILMTRTHRSVPPAMMRDLSHRR